MTMSLIPFLKALNLKISNKLKQFQRRNNFFSQENKCEESLMKINHKLKKRVTKIAKFKNTLKFLKTKQSQSLKLFAINLNRSVFYMKTMQPVISDTNAYDNKTKNKQRQKAEIQ